MRGSMMKWRCVKIALCGAVAALPGFCSLPGAGASDTDEGNDRLPYDVKEPLRSAYEIRGEGFVHNVGNLWLNVSNLGVVGNPWKMLSADPSCQFPPGSGVEYLWGAGLWVGAKVGDDPTPRVSTALEQLEFRPSTLALDTIYESYEGFPGGARLVNDDGDRDASGKDIIDEDIHDGKDNDGDGLIDEDFAAVSQQMFTCVYRDDTPEALNTYPEHVPMGLEITQRSFAWGVPGSDNFVGVEYTIKNDGRNNLRDVYLGFFCDADVGPVGDPFYWRDDRAGLVEVDTTIGGGGEGGCETRPQRLKFSIAETHDADGDGGRANGWFGVALLGHDTDIFWARKAPPTVGFTSLRFVSGGAAYEKCGDPRNDIQRYDLLSSNMIGCRPGELSAEKNGDYRIYFGIGPFDELEVGGELTLQIAFVVGEGRGGMIRDAVGAYKIFKGEYMDLDGDPRSGRSGEELCLTREPDQPVRTFDMVRHCGLPDEAYLGYSPEAITAPSCEENPIQWVNYDCDWCTGVGGKESIVRWIGATAPPCPQVKTSFPEDEPYPCHTLEIDEKTGMASLEPIRGPAVQLLTEDESVLIRWNNASELVADPLSKEFDFAGYKVWRAEQWERPEGSTGPTPELWVLLAEYWLPRYLEPGTRHMPLASARDPAVAVACDTVDAARGLYSFPVGYYRHRDEHVLPGFTYFYAVTAFDIDESSGGDPAGGGSEPFTLECRQVAGSDQAVVPSTNPVEGLGDVYVVPNPYYGGAEWDLGPNPSDPTGTHVDFMNLPKGPWTLRIYTLSGDLVRAFENDGGRDIGQVKWDLISRNGQDIVTGVYLYSIESRYGSRVGKFVILRESTYSR